MKVDVFDTYVTKNNGEKMHFDVLMPLGSNEKEATEFAVQWLNSIGVQEISIQLNSCRFCHTEEANLEIKQAIATQGFFILQMEGCPSPIL